MLWSKASLITYVDNSLKQPQDLSQWRANQGDKVAGKVRLADEDVEKLLKGLSKLYE